MLITIIIFIIILGLLVFVHECGHFIVARRNGITAHEFGFGFPPRIIGIVKNEQTGKWQIVRGNKVYEGQKTLYSLNWIPLGGFVRIKGEDGQDKDSDSFATKTAWIRTKVLGAGVVMNFILAWILISFAMGIGVPQPVNQAHGSAVVADPRVQVVSVAPGSPAESMGIRTGDELRVACTSGDSNCSSLAVTQNVQDFIAKNKGQEIVLEVKRGDRLVKLSGIPRIDAPEGEGSLGISMVETALVRYSFFEAIWRGLQTTFNLTVTIVLALYDIIATLLVGEKVSADLAGPVGIAFLNHFTFKLSPDFLKPFNLLDRLL